MDIQSPPINHAEVARLRRQSAQRKYKKRLRKVRLLWVVATVLFLILLGEMVVALCCSPRFWIYRVTVKNQETLHESEVIRLLNLPAFSNYYRVSLKELAGSIEREPRVARAEVKRGAIGTLEVNVHERQAVCRIGSLDPPLYMDAKGYLFMRPTPPAQPVPVLNGVTFAFAKEMLGKQAEFSERDAVLNCLRELRETPESRALEIARLSIMPTSRSGVYTLTAALRQGTLLYLGQPAFMHEKSICIQKTIAQANTKGLSLAQLKYITVDFVDDKTKDSGVLGIIRPKDSQEETEQP